MPPDGKKCDLSRAARTAGPPLVDVVLDMTVCCRSSFVYTENERLYCFCTFPQIQMLCIRRKINVADIVRINCVELKSSLRRFKSVTVKPMSVG